MLCSCHCHINHVHLLPVNFKQINETNHTYHRRSPFGQKYLCGKTGAQPRSQPCLPRHGTYMGWRVSQTSDTSSRKTRNWMDEYRRRKGAEPPFFIRTYRSDRLHNAVVHQPLLRPERRYRPSSRGPKEEFNRFTAQDATFIFVTNEIGMGGTSENEIQRKFTDMQGWMNQYIASRADEVILMVSGIPVKIKNWELRIEEYNENISYLPSGRNHPSGIDW